LKPSKIYLKLHLQTLVGEALTEQKHGEATWSMKKMLRRPILVEAIYSGTAETVSLHLPPPDDVFRDFGSE
jgi:hypothetical protein